MNESLPVDACLPQILHALHDNHAVILKAPPGAGKTTLVPPTILTTSLAANRKLLLIQPRRLAARAAAARIAKQFDEPVGAAVGYQVRFDSKTTASTRLISMTCGILLRRLQDDPLLDDVDCVILDEFHERSLEMDLALGMLQRIRTSLRPELKLVIMSATLQTDELVRYLGDAVEIHSEGRSFPVAIRYCPNLPSRSNQARGFARPRNELEQSVLSVLPMALRDTPGHLLVFLPGVGEIRRVRRAIEGASLGNDVSLYELYGDMSPADQDAVLAASTARKIVLATNVAETSITIPGVTGVIDSGTARTLRYDPHVGLPRLEIELISQASADQRAGRAGRTSPGVCYRLWSDVSHRSRRQHDVPEVVRGDLCDAVLRLIGWGERDILQFPWLTPPSEASIDGALNLLRSLGAINDDRSLTDTGRQMLRLPLHPRLARLMIASAQHDVFREAALVAAMFAERDPFRGTTITTQNHSASDARYSCDVAARVEALLDSDDGIGRDLNPGQVKTIHRSAQQIMRAGQMLVDSITTDINQDTWQQRLQRALLAAYPDRVARRRRLDGETLVGDHPRGVMIGGRGVKLSPQSLVQQASLFLCLDVDDAGSETLVRLAAPIERPWLDPLLTRCIDEPFYHPTLKAVVCRRREYYLDLMLNESPIACVPSPITAQVLATQARPMLDELISHQDERLSGLLRRLRFLNQQLPQLSLPAMNESEMNEVLWELCQTRTTMAELKSAPWADFILSRLTYDQLQILDREAPARLTLPSGNSVAVQYAEGKSPWIEVRIQEIFGWTTTPRIAMHSVPLQLHLLGPNYRPQQITEDLQSFWVNTYPEVKKELKRRYPKHHWPDDPLSAVSTKNGLKPQ